MSAPTNTSFATATDINSLPANITQQVDDAGTTYTVYYRIPGSVTLALTSPEIGVFGFGDLLTYIPSVKFYLGPAGAPTRIVSLLADWPKGVNFPIQVPIIAGNEYFIEVIPNGGNPAPANLTLQVLSANHNQIVSNDIVIPDDTIGFPACILAGNADYIIRRFAYPYSASEQGDILHTSGKNLMYRAPNSPFELNKLALYENDYSLDTLIGFSPEIGNTAPAIRANQVTQKFWIAYFNDPTLYAFSIDSAGVSSAVENIGDLGNGIRAVGINIDESTLYFVETSSIIKAYDLVNHVLLSDFAGNVSSYRVLDILTLSNGELVVGYFKSTVTPDFFVRHYDAAGNILHTYNFGSDLNTGSPCRMAYSLDNLTSFWVYISRPSSGANRGKSNVYKVQISDGTLLVTRTFAQFNQGQYTGAPTATPFADFGASSSCPFWIASAANVALGGLYTVSGTGAQDDGSGINPNPIIRHDKNWLDTTLGTQEDVKIPDPYYDTFLTGDE